MNSNSKTIRYALTKTSPIMVSYYLIAAGLGIVLQQTGWNWIWGMAMSLFLYTGAFQFVLASFLFAGASILTVVLTAAFMSIIQIKADACCILLCWHRGHGSQVLLREDFYQPFCQVP